MCGSIYLNMQRSLITLLLVLVGLFPASAEPVQASLESQTLAQLEQRLRVVDSELELLARFTPRNGVGSHGYRSKTHTKPDNRETIRIDLGEEVTIDEVILVPSLYRDSETGLRSGGFPVEFKIIVGTGDTSQVVASFSEEDNLLPRIAPLVVSFAPCRASWVSVDVSILSQAPNSSDDHSLQFSEIQVFSGMTNVALPLQRVSDRVNVQGRKAYLIDGFTPFLMNARGPSSQSRPIRITSSAKSSPLSLTIDLKTSQAVDQINLHTADMALSVPMHQFSCAAVPRHIRVVGANRLDFSDQTYLCEFEQKSIFNNGPIMMRRFPETNCRFIRFVILDTQSVVSLRKNEKTIAFSEIEVLSKSQNIALGAKVRLSAGLVSPPSTLEKITDGFNYYGAILPIRDWMHELSRRHDLEIERPLVLAELSRHYAQQQTNLLRMSWLVAVLVAGFVIGILILRLVHLKKMQKMRTRFAADLHDELGANLHTIALLSDAASVAHDSAEEWQMLHGRIRDVVGRTGVAIRNFSNIVGAEGLYLGLIEDVQRISQRILAKLDHTLEVSGEEFIEQLDVHTQVDLFLFYKESLMNICRHSNATRASTQLTASSNELVLTISDNGKGLAEQSIPAALKRRAKFLKAKLTVEKDPEGGTTIRLRLRKRRGVLPRLSRISKS